MIDQEATKLGDPCSTVIFLTLFGLGGAGEGEAKCSTEGFCIISQKRFNLSSPHLVTVNYIGHHFKLGTWG